MSLDVYVGPLVRYYAGDWENIAQRIAREQGLEYHTIRTEEKKDVITDRDQIMQIVTGWRDGLARSLSQHGVDSLYWLEDFETQYFTDRPAWDCFSDLILWAAYLEHPEFERPEESVEQWFEDSAYKLSREEDTRYPNLIGEVDIWLPIDLPFTFRAPDPGGNEINIGSSVALKRELEDINARSWQSDENTVQQWRVELGDHAAPLEDGAKFAYSIFYELSGKSVKHSLPVKLDY